MPEQLLDLAQVRAHVEQMRGVAVTQAVGVDALGEAPSAHALTRLRKAAAAARAALVVLADARRTGSFSDLVLDLSRARPRFTGSPPLLEGLEGSMHVTRSRIGPTFTPVPVQWPRAQRAEGECRASGSTRRRDRIEAA